MSSLQDIIKIAKTEKGKFFVMDEKGEAKLVILPFEEYQKLLLGKLKEQVQDVEKINEEITKAQIESGQVNVERYLVSKPKVQENFRAFTQPKVETADLREEVIDPSFDFEAPKMDLDSFWQNAENILKFICKN